MSTEVENLTINPVNCPWVESIILITGSVNPSAGTTKNCNTPVSAPTARVARKTPAYPNCNPLYNYPPRTVISMSYFVFYGKSFGDSRGNFISISIMEVVMVGMHLGEV